MLFRKWLSDYFRQAGVTPQLSTIYLLLRSRNFIIGGSVMNSTIPADLLELKARFETWRANRKFVREPIPDELWNAAADLSRRYPPSLVGRVLKLDSSRLKKFLLKRSPRTSVRKKLQATFFNSRPGLHYRRSDRLYRKSQLAVGFKSNGLTAHASR